VKLALEKNAAAVIVAHNHPSGMAEPSNADIDITQRLKTALALIDIRLLDHFIIGRGDITSLANEGKM
jgi:DNA repair protein RadC